MSVLEDAVVSKRKILLFLILDVVNEGQMTSRCDRLFPLKVLEILLRLVFLLLLILFINFNRNFLILRLDFIVIFWRLFILLLLRRNNSGI